MKYRIVKKECWWTSIFTTGQPKFLYYDFDLDHFEVGSYRTANKSKWEFSKKEVDMIRKEYNLDEEFFVDEVRGKGDKI